MYTSISYIVYSMYQVYICDVLETGDKKLSLVCVGCMIGSALFSYKQAWRPLFYTPYTELVHRHYNIITLYPGSI